jgi:hypothetical protein
VFERAQRLLVPGNCHKLAERLDKDVLKACLAAEKRIARFGEPHWSITLASARKKGQVLQKQLVSMLWTGIANQDRIESEWSALGIDESLPTRVRKCSTLLRLTKKEIQEIVSQSYQRQDQKRQHLIDSLMNSTKPRDQEHATRLRNLQKSEAIKQLLQKLKSLRLV